MSLPKFEDTRTAFEGLKSSLSFVDILLAGDIDARRVMACFSFLFHQPGKKKVHFCVFFLGVRPAQARPPPTRQSSAIVFKDN